MKELFELIESYGITLVLLVGSFYALYQFFFFSIKEVKKTFEKHHGDMDDVYYDLDTYYYNDIMTPYDYD